MGKSLSKVLVQSISVCEPSEQLTRNFLGSSLPLCLFITATGARVVWPGLEASIDHVVYEAAASTLTAQ